MYFFANLVVLSLVVLGLSGQDISSAPIRRLASIRRTAPRLLPLPVPVCPVDDLDSSQLDFLSLLEEEDLRSKNWCDTGSKCGIKGGICIPADETCKDNNIESGPGYCNAKNRPHNSCKCCLTPTVYMRDIENTIAYALRNRAPYNISGPGPYRTLYKAELEALNSFAAALVIHLPLRPPVEKFLNCLRTTLTFLTSGSFIQMTGECLFLIYNKCESQTTTSSGEIGLPHIREWIGCKNFENPGLTQFRSYPCGVWTTFHAITVNLLNGPQKDVANVLPTLHGMVKHFPWCNDCKNHFKAMYTARKGRSMKTADKVAMWLWSAHNQVSVRIATEPTNILEENTHFEPNRPKSIFPDFKLCLSCWVHKENKDDFETHTDATQVLNYLTKLYSRNEIIQECPLLTNDCR